MREFPEIETQSLHPRGGKELDGIVVNKGDKKEYVRCLVLMRQCKMLF